MACRNACLLADTWPPPTTPCPSPAEGVLTPSRHRILNRVLAHAAQPSL